MPFITDWKESENRCPKCGGPCECRVWESYDEAHEDILIKCSDCDHDWWVEGIDS